MAKIHISRTFNQLVEVDFADDGADATSLHIQDNSSSYSMITFMGRNKKKGQTAGKAARAVLAKWIGISGTPDIILDTKDAIFSRKASPLLRDRRNIPLQTVIHGHRQSLGCTERGHMHVRAILSQIKDKRMKKNRIRRLAIICGVRDVSVKFASATIRRFYAGETSFRTGAQNADWGGGQSILQCFCE